VKAGGAGDLRARRKVLVVIAEDWFALSHFIPLVSELAAQGDEVVVVTRSSGRLPDI
jgi:hypothetical protein